MTKEKLEAFKYLDPTKVFDELGIEYKTTPANKIWVSLANGDSNASAQFKYDNGWKYTNYSNSARYRGGDIVTAIMEFKQDDFNDASQLAHKIYYGSFDYDNDLTEKEKQDLEIKKSEYKEIQAKSQIDYEVLICDKVNEFSNDAKNFLRKRGITRIPNNAYDIKVQYDKEYDGGVVKTIERRGICIPYTEMSDKKIDKTNIKEFGFDMHLYEPITFRNGTVLKTQSFGSKEISSNFRGSNIFSIDESKMDYFAINKEDISLETNEICANGTGNVQKVINEIKERAEQLGLKENEIILRHFNQNDRAGYTFNLEIAKAFPQASNQIIVYNRNEIGDDINDLIEKRVDVSTRLASINLVSLEIMKLKHITISVLDKFDSTKKETLGNMAFMIKNLHKFSGNDAPISNLILSSESHFNTKADLLNRKTKEELEEFDVKINEKSFPTVLFKKEYSQAKEKFVLRPVPYYSIKDTNLYRDKNSFDKYEPNNYYANFINEKNDFFTLLQKRATAIGVNSNIDTNNQSFKESTYQLLTEVVKQSIPKEKEHIQELVVFALYSRVDYESTDFLKHIEKPLESVVENKDNIKAELNQVFQNTTFISTKLNLDKLIEVYKANFESNTFKDYKDIDLKDAYVSVFPSENDNKNKISRGNFHNNKEKKEITSLSQLNINTSPNESKNAINRT